MIALLQRVTRAGITVGGDVIANIDRGILVLLAVEHDDTPAVADKLLSRILTYRIFPDDQDRMNLSLVDTNGGLLIAPQFTLAADTKKGTRPSFTPAASPELGEELFNYIVDRASEQHDKVSCGQFGADMKVSLINDGPVTFSLRTSSGQNKE
ncbi:MAG: D-aminoacyl-tRNA deacylase [Gammaproteobacteria bacterium]